ncbi:malectin domain-containing carbohydrate-binding protein [Cystobacter ferrugineus]|uniref:malectin domain-containing carbohydrate-binding protein n=1 Tax=Cystobacter ferrugineus TaxID=83449 RepID=UPI0009FECDE3|nr:malectin domain-containing carbohydrate-binding protein [Cystobacter ferrugineus]
MKVVSQVLVSLLCSASVAGCLSPEEPGGQTDAAFSETAAAVTDGASVERTVLPPHDVYAVNAGGAAAGGFTADDYFTQGDVFSNVSQPVYTTDVYLAGPPEIYSDARQGGQFGYSFTGLTPGINYAVVLHFAELYFSMPRQRRFNVSLNGTVHTNIDIVSLAGGPFKATTLLYFVRADTNGIINVDFSRGANDQPMVNGIEVRVIE